MYCRPARLHSICFVFPLHTEIEELKKDRGRYYGGCLYKHSTQS